MTYEDEDIINDDLEETQYISYTKDDADEDYIERLLENGGPAIDEDDELDIFDK